MKRKKKTQRGLAQNTLISLQTRQKALAQLFGIQSEYIKRIDLGHYQIGNIVYEVLTQNEVNKLPIAMTHFIKVDVGDRRYAVRELSEKVLKKYGIKKLNI